MMNRIQHSLHILKESFHVLRKDRELLFFPIISLAVLALLVYVFLKSVLSFSIEGRSLQLSFHPQTALVSLLIFYLVAYAVIVFFNSGLVGCALMRLEGRDPTVGDGLRIGLNRLPNILGWALIAATVGVLLKLLENRLGGGSDGDNLSPGEVASGVLGAAWSVMTALVIPVLIVERTNPVSSIKRSSQLLKETWGEQFAGGIGLGLLVFLLAFLGALPILLASAAQSVTPKVIGIVVALIYWLALGVLYSTLNSVFHAALYQYATTGETAEGFSRQSLTRHD